MGTGAPTMKFTQRVSFALLVLLFDLVVFFLPLAACFIAYVLLARPAWFPGWVERVYRDES